METITLNKHTIEMYTSIEELPAYNYMRLNLFLMMDSGIGSDIEGIKNRVTNIVRFANNKDPERYIPEAENLIQAFTFVIQEINPEMFSFVPFIHSINGKEFTDLSDENVKKTILMLSKKGLTVGKIRGFVDRVKKKLTWKWKPFSRPENP